MAAILPAMAQLTYQGVQSHAPAQTYGRPRRRNNQTRVGVVPTTGPVPGETSHQREVRIINNMRARRRPPAPGIGDVRVADDPPPPPPPRPYGMGDVQASSQGVPTAQDAYAAQRMLNMRRQQQQFWAARGIDPQQYTGRPNYDPIPHGAGTRRMLGGGYYTDNAYDLGGGQMAGAVSTMPERRMTSGEIARRSIDQHRQHNALDAQWAMRYTPQMLKPTYEQQRPQEAPRARVGEIITGPPKTPLSPEMEARRQAGIERAQNKRAGLREGRRNRMITRGGRYGPLTHLQPTNGFSYNPRTNGFDPVDTSLVSRKQKHEENIRNTMTVGDDGNPQVNKDALLAATMRDYPDNPEEALPLLRESGYTDEEIAQMHDDAKGSIAGLGGDPRRARWLGGLVQAAGIEEQSDALENLDPIGAGLGYTAGLAGGPVTSMAGMFGLGRLPITDYINSAVDIAADNPLLSLAGSGAYPITGPGLIGLVPWAYRKLHGGGKRGKRRQKQEAAAQQPVVQPRPTSHEPDYGFGYGGMW